MSRSQPHLRVSQSLVLVLLLVVVTPAISWAGMPSPLPEDMATVLRLGNAPTQRLQVISFFVLGLLLSALAVQWLWNGLRRDLSRLPRLSYGRSLLVTVAWGLLCCIVLVMISGARELMTPGAWERNGATYRLSQGQHTRAEIDQR